MNRKMIVASTAVVLCLSAPAYPAFAQMNPGDGGGPMMQDNSGKEPSPEQFSDFKARILSKIEERKKRLDQEKACVEASKNMEDLKNCRPERPAGGQRPMGGGFQGRQRGPMGGQQ